MGRDGLDHLLEGRVDLLGARVSLRVSCLINLMGQLLEVVDTFLDFLGGSTND